MGNIVVDFVYNVDFVDFLSCDSWVSISTVYALLFTTAAERGWWQRVRDRHKPKPNGHKNMNRYFKVFNW